MDKNLDMFGAREHVERDHGLDLITIWGKYDFEVPQKNLQVAG